MKECEKMDKTISTDKKALRLAITRLKTKFLTSDLNVNMNRFNF